MTTQEYLKSVLRYDPKTGLFVWIRNSYVKKSVAGCLTRKGYICIKISGIGYLAHRLAWLYVYGYMPKQLDHKDRNRANNRIGNLREATNSQNAINKKRKNKFTGVVQRGNKWLAQIEVDGKKYHIGVFSSPEFAAKAYDEAAKRYHGEFASLNFV